MSVISPREFISKSGKKIVIRSAEPNDASELLRLGKEVMAEEIYTLTTPEELSATVEQQMKWVEDMNAHPGKIILVATFEGRLISILDFSCGHRKRIAHTGEFGVSIDKDFREEGIGTHIMNALLSWATDHPVIEKVNLRVHVNNTRARNLYLKLGFIEEGRLKNDMKYGPSSYVDTIVMGRFVKTV